MEPTQEIFVDGDAVGTWTDRSLSSNNATQATGSSKPTFRTNVFHGKPALYFDAGDHLQFGSNITASTPSVFIAANRYTRLNYSVLLQIQKLGVHAYLNTAQTWGVFNNGERSAGALLNYEPVILSVLYNGASTITLYSNGQKVSAGGGSDAAGSTSRIGVDGGGTQFHYGFIAEIIIYNNIVTDGSRIAIEKYLSNKYGIARGNYGA